MAFRVGRYIALARVVLRGCLHVGNLLVLVLELTPFLLFGNWLLLMRRCFRRELL